MMSHNVHRPLFLSLTQIRSNSHFAACVAAFEDAMVIVIHVGVGAIAEEAEVDRGMR